MSNIISTLVIYDVILCRTLLEEICSLNSIADATRDEEMTDDNTGTLQGKGLLQDR